MSDLNLFDDPDPDEEMPSGPFGKAPKDSDEAELGLLDTLPQDQIDGFYAALAKIDAAKNGGGNDDDDEEGKAAGDSPLEPDRSDDFHPDFGWGLKSPDGAFFTDEEGVVHPIRGAEGYSPAQGGDKPSSKPASKPAEKPKDSAATARYKADRDRFKGNKDFEKLTANVKAGWTSTRAKAVEKAYQELRKAGHSHEDIVRSLSAQLGASARSVDTRLTSRMGVLTRPDSLSPEQHTQIDADRNEGKATVDAQKTDGPVSGALRVTGGTTTFKETMGRTLGIIDKVHSDGKLPEITLRTQTASESRGAHGTYFPRPGERAEIAIGMGSTGSHPELTAAHEIGHFIDNQGLPSEAHPGGSMNGSAGTWGSYQPTGAMKEVMGAIGKTEAVQTLRDHVAGSLREQGIPASTDSRYKSYYLQPHEQFARAYAQYVATKSGDSKMLAQVQSIRDSQYKISANSQWSHEDFKPVATAFDNLMKERGWGPKA